eukprot:1158129-Pelagomonas_calceolata.AAC.9
MEQVRMPAQNRATSYATYAMYDHLRPVPAEGLPFLTNTLKPISSTHGSPELVEVPLDVLRQANTQCRGFLPGNEGGLIKQMHDCSSPTE